MSGERSDLTLVVNEIFFSIQGEGARAGCPSIFVRLANCNLVCAFCDTEFESGEVLSLSQIHAKIKQYPCRDIVWTGGEPLLQLKEEHVAYFRSLGYYNCLETNGTVKIFRGFDYIAVSPKVAEHVLAKNCSDVSVDELRYVRHVGQTVPKPSVEAKYYFISPEFTGGALKKENLQHCIDLVLQNPGWRLSVQYHKMLGVR